MAVDLLFIIAGAFGLGTIFGSVLKTDWLVLGEPTEVKTIVIWEKGEER